MPGRETLELSELQLPQGPLGGEVAAHAVDTATGRGRGGAEEDLGQRGAVERGRGPEEELARGHGAARDVAPDEIWVPLFEIAARHDAAGEDAVGKAGSEAFHLGFDG